MFCPECGTKMEENANFCPMCGWPDNKTAGVNKKYFKWLIVLILFIMAIISTKFIVTNFSTSKPPVIFELPKVKKGDEITISTKFIRSSDGTVVRTDYNTLSYDQYLERFEEGRQLGELVSTSEELISLEPSGQQLYTLEASIYSINNMTLDDFFDSMLESE